MDSTSVVRFSQLGRTSNCNIGNGIVGSCWYLLEIDQTRILLDCGWRHEIDPFEAAEGCFGEDELELLGQLDAILISHGDLRHLGGLPALWAWIRGRAGRSSRPPPVLLATVPVHHLGLVTLYDAHQGWWGPRGGKDSTTTTTNNHVNSPMPTSLLLDNIDGAFEAMTLLRYSQPYRITPQITVTAVPAGHTLGGSMWRIQRSSLIDGSGGAGGSSNTNGTILYAGQFNHRREAHLDGAIFEFGGGGGGGASNTHQANRPALLIVDGSGSLDLPIPRKQRDAELVEAVEAGLKLGGTVLMPIDTASRVLEVMAVLEAHYRLAASSSNKSPKIVLLSYQSKRLLELLKGMLEWMGSELTKSTPPPVPQSRSSSSKGRDDPWNLQHILPITTPTELAAIPEPRLVLGSLSELEGGMGRGLFVSIAASSKNTLLMPWKPTGGSLAATVLAAPQGQSLRVNIEIHEQVPLEGAELASFERNRQLMQEQAAAEEAFARLKKRREGGEGSSDDEESEGEEDEDGEDTTTTTAIDGARSKGPLIDSARTLRTVYWTDYRHDWYVSGDGGGGEADESVVNDAASNPTDPLYPLSRKRQRFRHQMFPFREDHRNRFEDYGEPMEPDEWASLFGREQQQQQMVPNIATTIPKPTIVDGKGGDGGLDGTNDQQQTPTKWISYTRQIQVRCGRRVLGGEGFRGLVDGRSLQTIISRMAPRNLIIVGSSAGAAAVEYLANHVRFSAGGNTTRVYNPGAGEVVSLQSDLLVRQAILDEQLVGQLWVDWMGDVEMAYLRAFIGGGGAQQERGLEESDTEDLAISGPVRLIVTPDQSVLDTLAATNNNIPRSPVMIGDPRLSDLVRLIAQIPIQADFGPNGDLICAGGKVRILRAGEEESISGDGGGGGDGGKHQHSSRLLVEGSVCAEFYQIRDLVYSQVAIL